MKKLIIIMFVALAASVLSSLANAEATPPVAQTATELSDKTAMQRDRARSQRLAPADRERAQKIFAAAFSLWQAGKFDEAKLGFERGLGIDPANGPGNFYLGEILARANDQEGARARYTRAKFFAPDSVEGLEAEVALGKLPPPAGPVLRDCADCPEMVEVPPGEFQMGDTTLPQSQPVHRVRVEQSLDVGKYDVTFDEWDACVREGGCRGGVSDSSWGRGRRPVINVSWNDAKAYAAWLSRKTGKPYRLLTEAEWEYAARGGRTTAYWWGDEIGRGHANCNGCGSKWDGNQTAPVGSFAPNPFGLYNMAGNVWQWTEDCYNENYVGAPADSSVALTCGGPFGHLGDRVARGGSWNYPVSRARAGSRDSYVVAIRFDRLGFRVARPL